METAEAGDWIVPMQRSRPEEMHSIFSNGARTVHPNPYPKIAKPGEPFPGGETFCRPACLQIGRDFVTFAITIQPFAGAGDKHPASGV
jgi:hypothetical protein